MREGARLAPGRLRARTWLQALLIVAGAGFVYSAAFRGGWIWDDYNEIVENRLVHDPQGWLKLWTGGGNVDYFPLKTAVQWIQWRLWGNDTLGYHLTSFALHCASALLLWRLLRKLGVRSAWLGGLLFAVHPLGIESAAWVSELKNALSLPPLLLSFGAWIDWDESAFAGLSGFASLRRDKPGPSGERRHLVRSLAWFLIAMLCKTSAVMFPVCLLLHAWWRRGRVGLREGLASAPFFGISLALGSVTWWFQRHYAIAGTDLAAGGFLSRLALAGSAVVFYLSKAVVPWRLALNYPRWESPALSVTPFLPWLAVAAILAWASARRGAVRRHLLFGAGWFLLNLAPFLGILAMAYQKISRVADHFAYIPLLGVIGLAAAGMGCLRRAPRAAVAVAVCAAFLWAGRRYAGVFRDQEGLWDYELRVNPGAWQAENNLGLLLASSGRTAEAIAHYRRAVQLNRNYPEALNNLGNALRQAGSPPQAIDAFQAALKLKPDYADPCNGWGNALQDEGRTAEAIAKYAEALRLKPSYPEAYNDLAVALYKTGRIDDAIADLKEALRLNPDYAEARGNLKTVLKYAESRKSSGGAAGPGRSRIERLRE